MHCGACLILACTYYERSLVHTSQSTFPTLVRVVLLQYQLLVLVVLASTSSMHNILILASTRVYNTSSYYIIQKINLYSLPCMEFFSFFPSHDRRQKNSQSQTRAKRVVIIPIRKCHPLSTKPTELQLEERSSKLHSFHGLSPARFAEGDSSLSKVMGRSHDPGSYALSLTTRPMGQQPVRHYQKQSPRKMARSMSGRNHDERSLQVRGDHRAAMPV